MLVTILTIFADLCNFCLPNSLAEVILKKLAVNDPLPPSKGRVVIMPVAHGTTIDNRPTAGLKTVVKETYFLATIHYQGKATLIYNAYSQSPDPSIERRFKEDHLGGIYGGLAESSIDEVVNADEIFSKEGLPDVFIWQTDQAHSIRAKIILQAFYPDTTVCVRSVLVRDTIDPKSAMGTYHNIWRILILQIAPTPLFWWWSRKGKKYLATKAGFHQPAAK